MIKRALVMLAALAAVTFSQAQDSITITYQGGTGPTVPNMVDSGGIAVPNSTLTVEIGYFPSTFNVAANENNLASLESNWHQFDATDIITALGVFPGAFSRTSPANQDTQFNNQHIDLWVFKTSDNAAPNLVSFANVLEYGIFTRVNTSNPWQFPTAGPGTSMSIDTSQVDTAFHGLLNANSLELQPVPEPSSAAVLGLGAAVLVFLRRGRQ